jgi:hypothetical protein
MLRQACGSRTICAIRIELEGRQAISQGYESHGGPPPHPGKRIWIIDARTELRSHPVADPAGWTPTPTRIPDKQMKLVLVPWLSPFSFQGPNADNFFAKAVVASNSPQSFIWRPTHRPPTLKTPKGDRRSHGSPLRSRSINSSAAGLSGSLCCRRCLTWFDGLIQ